MKESNYFAQARDYANQRFLGADGWEADGDWENAFGDELPADAGAAAVEAPAQVASQPYIITLTCGSVNLTDVEVLNAALRQLSPTTAGVTFTYSIPGITYTQFLAGISTGKSFKVSQVRLSASNASSSVAVQQVQETVSITQKDLNGNTLGKPLIFNMDSYQYSQTIIDLFSDFDVDGLTSMIISTLYAGTSLKIYLYPSARINQFKQLAGNVPISTYKNPVTNRVLGRKVALGIGTAK
ncbi:MAG: hypothetical protein PHT07_15230 [Paludibacter sp.]|nr:hypothetical protein [Paludibacter sp.]